MITLTKVWQVSFSMLTEKVHSIIKKGQNEKPMTFRESNLPEKPINKELLITLEFLLD
jgi:hypothetical protein